jgi:hypothetical protein
MELVFLPVSQMYSIQSGVLNNEPCDNHQSLIKLLERLDQRSWGSSVSTVTRLHMDDDLIGI